MATLSTAVDTVEVSKSPRFHQVIYEVLKKNLCDGRLPAGLILSDSDIGRLFDVSRAPARRALLRLADEGFLEHHASRGFMVVGGGQTVPFRRPLERVPIDIPKGVAEKMRFRNSRDQIYPEIERDVAAALPFGRFQLTEANVATHFQTSRTVARELLACLERVGLIQKQKNGRWHAGPLTERRLRNHYEMRCLLEPTALAEVMPQITLAEIQAKIENHRHLLELEDSIQIAQLIQIERDIHFDMVLRCSNEELRKAIYQNLLPLVATHYSLESTSTRRLRHETITEHIEILEALRKGDRDKVMTAMRNHLEAGLKKSSKRLAHLDLTLSQKQVPTFLKPIS